MNKLQKAIIVVGAVVGISMGLIPPWTNIYTIPFHQKNPAGYALLFSPPYPEENSYGLGGSVELDIDRLIIQWVIVAMAIGLGIVLANKKPGNVKKKFLLNKIKQKNLMKRIYLSPTNSKFH